MIALDVLHQISAASSRVAQEKIILDAYGANCFEFFEAAKLAADPFISFGVKKVAEILEDDGAAGTFTFAAFRTLCNRLQARTLSGDAARLAIRAAAEHCHVGTWNELYRRVLLKDLGIDVSIINQMLARLGSDVDSFQIPIFRCQIPSVTNKPPPGGLRLLDVKLDGTRLLAVLGASVGLYTANGALSSCHDLETALHPLATRLPAPIVLDGVRIANGQFVVFDLIPLCDFRNRLCLRRQCDRRTMLEHLARSGAFSDTQLVRVLPQIEVDVRTDAGRNAFAEFNQHAISHGHTAIVIKKPEASYVGKRTTAWLIRKAESAVTNT
jgi:hypothetical protein